MTTYIRWFRDIRLADIGLVGGKTASLGELYGQLGAAGVRVPDGFAVTAEAYRALLDADGLRARLAGILRSVRVDDVEALAAAGAQLRRLVEEAPLPAGLEEQILAAYRTLGRGRAIRSPPSRSAPARRPRICPRRASPASTRASWACAETPRCSPPSGAASPRSSPTARSSTASRTGFDHLAVLLSVAVQRMVDAGARELRRHVHAGPGHRLPRRRARQRRLRPRGSGGTGAARSRRVPHLQADASQRPSRPAQAEDRPEDLEAHDGGRDGEPERTEIPAGGAAHAKSHRRRGARARAASRWPSRSTTPRRRRHPVPMDIEWAKDAADGRLYILQARPETVHRAERRAVIEVFSLAPDAARERLVRGVAIGQRIGAGPTRHLAQPPRPGLVPDGRRARGVHDGSRLGADHEARGGHRDGPWRPHLSRRHREPRARRAVRGRHGQRHRGAARWPGRHRVVRRGGEPGPCIAARCRSSGGRSISRRCRGPGRR